MINFFWGLFNLAAGLILIKVSPISVGLNPGFIVFLLGIAVLGTQLSRHFGAVRSSKHI